MTLTQGASQYPPESGGAKGLAVFNAIAAAVKRNITVRLVIGVRVCCIAHLFVAHTQARSGPLWTATATRTPARSRRSA